LADDPAVFALLGLSDCVDVEHVIGRLYKLWSWADRHCKTGRISVSRTWLAEYVGGEKFFGALQKVGWMRVTKTGVSFPHFDRHMSQGAKSRALAAIRQAQHRSRKSNAGCNDASVTKTSPEERRIEENRIEKRRGEMPSISEVLAKKKGPKK
jgi:hypothetical protein